MQGSIGLEGDEMPEMICMEHIWQPAYLSLALCPYIKKNQLIGKYFKM